MSVSRWVVIKLKQLTHASYIHLSKTDGRIYQNFQRRMYIFQQHLLLNHHHCQKYLSAVDRTAMECIMNAMFCSSNWRMWMWMVIGNGRNCEIWSDITIGALGCTGMNLINFWVLVVCEGIRTLMSMMWTRMYGMICRNHFILITWASAAFGIIISFGLVMTAKCVTLKCLIKSQINGYRDKLKKICNRRIKRQEFGSGFECFPLLGGVKFIRNRKSNMLLSTLVIRNFLTGHTFCSLFVSVDRIEWMLVLSIQNRKYVRLTLTY